LARGLTIAYGDAEIEEALKGRNERVSKLFDKFGALPGLQKQPDSYADPALDMEDASLIGNPDQIIERLQILQNMGFEHILILLPEEMESLRIFAKEVMPAFSQTEATDRIANS